jgi:hypothetical protein
MEERSTTFEASLWCDGALVGCRHCHVREESYETQQSGQTRGSHGARAFFGWREASEVGWGKRL